MMSSSTSEAKAKHAVKEVTDRNYLLLNENFAGLIDSIQLKTGTRPELGRILTDKGYKQQPKNKKEYALYAYVKECPPAQASGKVTTR